MVGRPMLGDSQESFKDGLNTTADLSQLGRAELRRAENARLSEFGAVSKRRGTKRTHSAALAAAILGGFSWDRASGVEQLVVANGDLHTGVYGIPITWSNEGGTLSGSVLPSFASFRDGSAEVAYLADGGLLNKWDGSTLTENIAGTPAVKVIAVYNQRLYGITGDDETLYWGPLNNGDGLGNVGAGGGSAIVRTFGKMRLRGLLPLGSSLLLFHVQGISRFTGWTQDDVSIATGTQGVSADVGTIAPHAIVAVENVGYFLSDRGVYEVTEGGVRSISSKIETVLQSLSQADFVRARAVHCKAAREVWFYLPDVGIYAYNYRLGSWTGPWTGVFVDQTPQALWPALDTSSTPIVLSGHADGFVRKCDEPTIKDDVLSDSSGGTTYSLIAQFRRFYFRRPTHEKALRWLSVTANLRGSTTAALSWAMEVAANASETLPATAGGVWGSGTWGSGTWGGQQSKPLTVHAHGRGPSLDVTLTDDAAAELVISRLEAQAFDMGQRR